MASIYGLSLKSLKEFVGREGPAYQGNLYLGKKKIGFWSQDGNGAILDDFFLEREYSEIKLRDRIKELSRNVSENKVTPIGEVWEYKNIQYDAENLMSDLLTLNFHEKLFKKEIKNGYFVMVLSDGFNAMSVSISKSSKYMDMSDDELKKAADVDRLFQENEFYPSGHNVSIYRSIEDFDIMPDAIKISDIKR